MTPAERAIQVCEELARQYGDREHYVRIGLSTTIAAAISAAVNDALERAAREADSPMAAKRIRALKEPA